jgi:hypothetical protein
VHTWRAECGDSNVLARIYIRASSSCTALLKWNRSAQFHR